MTNNLLTIIPPAIQAFVEGAAEEVLAAIVEYEFDRRQIYLKMWWSVGGIIQDWRQAAEKKVGQPVPLKPFVCNVLQRIGRSVESGYKAVQFREHFPTEESLETLPFGKAASWHLVVNKVLPGLSAGKSLAEIAAEDRKDMAERKGKKPPITLYDGPGILAHLRGPRGQVWLVELPASAKLPAGARAGDEVIAVLKEKP